jgi:membrane protein YqaA with SNARE-associated domain
MIHHFISVFAIPAVSRNVHQWIFQLGGIGFIPLGLLDSSVIPLPGSVDVLDIVLAAQNPELWVYYAVMATLGSVLGGYVTYRIARKGGKETLEKKFSGRTVQRVYRIFDRWGFGAIAVGALLPPPVPFVPVLFAAGAMQYSVKKFLVAITLGRIVRYSVLAFLAARYGRQVLKILSLNGHPITVALIGIAVSFLALLAFLLVAKRAKLARLSS